MKLVVIVLEVDLTTDLLVTKLHIPVVRANLVSRPRLIEALSQGWNLGKNLTLVTAPAGYGKTTLVTEWLRVSGVKTAWLSLDESDNDPTRFLSYLVAALRQVDQRLGEGVRVMLQSPQPPPREVVLTSLLNEVSSVSQPFILALDDYHTIHTPSIHGQIAFILEHQPAQMHLVILTREDPPLPLARLRASGQMSEIRENDLRFLPDECTKFLRQVMGLKLSSQNIADLERRTEGWIAGLQLAALSLHGDVDPEAFIRAFTGSSRFVMDYLVDEVFRRQSAEAQDFLLQTAILERLSGPLCDAVAGRSESQNMLEALEQANLFLFPLDLSRQWYRYHRLFSELLRHRLHLHGGFSEGILHERASRWFEAQGHISEAIQHALASQDWERAARLIGQATDGMLKRGEMDTLIGWFQKMPEELIRSLPELAMSYVWALLLIGKFDEAEVLLAAFEVIVQSTPALLGNVVAAQAYAARARGDNQLVIERSELALGLVPENDVATRSILSLNLGLVYWHEGRLQEAVPSLNEAQALAMRTQNHYAGLTAQIFLARTLASQGELRKAEGMLCKTIEDGGNVPILVLAHYDLAGIYYEWNELGKAWSHVEQGLEISTRSGNVEFQNGGHVLKACVLVAQGNMRGALAEADTSYALSQAYGPATQNRSMACLAQVALAMSDVAMAKLWVEQMTEDIDVNSFFRFLGLSKARLLLALGDRATARNLLSERLTRATQAGWGYANVAIRALQPLAAETQEIALENLAEVSKLSRNEGFIRTYVDAGAGLHPSAARIRPAGDHAGLRRADLECIRCKEGASFGAGRAVERS